MKEIIENHFWWQDASLQYVETWSFAEVGGYKKIVLAVAKSVVRPRPGFVFWFQNPAPVDLELTVIALQLTKCRSGFGKVCNILITATSQLIHQIAKSSRGPRLLLELWWCFKSVVATSFSHFFSVFSSLSIYDIRSRRRGDHLSQHGGWLYIIPDISSQNHWEFLEGNVWCYNLLWHNFGDYDGFQFFQWSGGNCWMM